MSLPANLRALLNTRPFFQPLIKVRLGDQLATLQEGLVSGHTDPKTGHTVNAGFGFDPGAISAQAASLASTSTTTSSTAGTSSTVTYSVPDAPTTWKGKAWVETGNGYITKAPTYSSGTLTITVASAATSQTLAIAIWNG